MSRMMEAMNPQREGASLGLDESFCVISPDGSSMTPPAVAATPQVPTSTIGAVAPPTNTTPPGHLHQAQYPPGYATPSPSPQTPANASLQESRQDTPGPPPTSGPYSSGARMSALRPKHKPNYPTPVSTGALFQPSGAPEQRAANYQSLAQGEVAYSPPAPGAPQMQGMASAPFGHDPYASPAPQAYGSQPPANSAEGGGLWGWVAQATTSVVESAQKIVNNPDYLMEEAQKLGRNLVDKTKVR